MRYFLAARRRFCSGPGGEKKKAKLSGSVPVFFVFLKVYLWSGGTLYPISQKYLKNISDRDRDCQVKVWRESNPSLSRDYQPRSGRRGNENLIVATLSCPLNDKREQNMSSPD
jgi:hypothetical protein